jgi:hypothetical protein
MPTDEAPDLFYVDKRFLKRYENLLVAHSSGAKMVSESHLLTTISSELGCIAAAVVEVGPEEDPRVMDCQPTRERSFVERVLKELATKVYSLLEDGNFIGESVPLEDVFEHLPYLQIDIIPLPRLADTDDHPKPTKLYLVIEPRYMAMVAKDKYQRDLQRIMLAQFLQSWATRVTAPRPDLPNTQSLSKLVDNQRKQIRAQRKSGQLGDRDNLKKTKFWENWKPRLSGSTPDEAGWKPIRDQGEILVDVWGLWVESHHFIESERSTGGYLQAQDKKGAKSRKNHSIGGWVEDQRSDPVKLAEQIKHLRKLSAEAFQNGTPDQPNRSTPQDQEPNPLIPQDQEPEFLLGNLALLRYGMNLWLDEQGQIVKELESGVLSDVEFCRGMHGIAVTAHYLMAGHPSAPDPDIIHRLMQLVSRYSHVQLGIPARVDLRAHLLQAARGEPALLALKHSYRDHFFHVLEVCFLGHMLLETKIDSHRHLWNFVADQMALGSNKTLVLRLWYMAALLHDVGYAMDVLESSCKHLKFFKHSKSLQGLVSEFENAIEGLAKDPEVKTFCLNPDEMGECPDEIERDHGVVGALHVRALLKKIHETDKSVAPEDYEPAIQAIARHNLRRPGDKIMFTQEPLAFLLALCDQLQEWRRPRLPYAISPYVLLAGMQGGTGDDNQSNDAVKKMVVSLVAKATDTGEIELSLPDLEKERPLLRFTIEYDENINKLSGVFYVWLDATLSFQRLDFDSFPLDIQVTYKTPPLEPLVPGRGVPRRQMHRLRDAAHETHMTFLADWFPDEPVSDQPPGTLGNRAITYYYDDQDRPMERVTLDLREMSKKVRMTQGLRRFKDCLETWKHYVDEQEFPGDYAVAVPE